jgi:hypothetical protein
MNDFLDSTYKTKYDEYGNLVYFENATGWWWKKEFDKDGNLLYSGDSTGMWIRKEYDENGNQTRYQNYLGIDTKRKK